MSADIADAGGCTRTPGTLPPDAEGVLRRELEIVPGPAAPDGSPTCTVHDPVRDTFDQADWPQMEIISRLRRGLQPARIAADLIRTTTLRLTTAQVRALCADLADRGLTRAGTVAAAQPPAPGVVALLQWLLHHYLYFRIPLLQPDAWLTRALPWARLLTRRPLLVAWFSLCATGMLLLLQRWDAYLATLPRFFHWQGLLAYALALAALKCVHEFAHAFSAKACGLRVPAMGVALVVLWPLPYCDVSDAWRLASRRRRLLISIAGVAAETVVAGAALLLWACAEPGLLRSVCFVISSGSLVSSLLVNLNPAMRYDGYYLASDLLEVDNLRARSVDMARWFLRRHLLGMPLPCPEAALGAWRRRLLFAYSLYAWCYRLALYLGIAIIVYHKFTKLVGMALFAVELGYFILAPAAREAASIWRERHRLRWNRSSGATGMLLLALLLWALLPLPRTCTVPAITLPARMQVIYAPFAGRIESLAAATGNRRVSRGEPLIAIAPPAHRQQLLLLETRARALQREILLLGMEPASRSLLAEKRELLGMLRARVRRLREELAQGCVRARFGGILHWEDDTLAPGAYSRRDARLGTVIRPGEWLVDCYLGQEERACLRTGTQVRFFARAACKSLRGRVFAIMPVDAIPAAHAALTSRAGGPIALRRDKDGSLRPLDGLYLARVRLAAGSLHRGDIGSVSFTTPPRSLAGQWLRRAYRALVRESGL